MTLTRKRWLAGGALTLILAGITALALAPVYRVHVLACPLQGPEQGTCTVGLVPDASFLDPEECEARREVAHADMIARFTQGYPFPLGLDSMCYPSGRHLDPSDFAGENATLIRPKPKGSAI